MIQLYLKILHNNYHKIYIYLNYIKKYDIMINNKSDISLRFSAIDCDTSTKYYQLTQKISDEQKQLVKPYFEYYTPEKFSNKENVAGNLEGWMCKDEDIQTVEELLGIYEHHKKRMAKLEAIDEKIENTLKDSIKDIDCLLELNI